MSWVQSLNAPAISGADLIVQAFAPPFPGDRNSQAGELAGCGHRPRQSSGRQPPVRNSSGMRLRPPPWLRERLFSIGNRACRRRAFSSSDPSPTRRSPWHSHSGKSNHELIHLARNCSFFQKRRLVSAHPQKCRGSLPQGRSRKDSGFPGRNLAHYDDDGCYADSVAFPLIRGIFV